MQKSDLPSFYSVLCCLVFVYFVCQPKLVVDIMYKLTAYHYQLF